MRERLLIAIDGPAGSGKSTCARRLAERLGYRFLDTGALYRAVTLAALRSGLRPADGEGIAALARRVRVELTADAAGARVSLDGGDVTSEIRGPDVTNAVSTVAAHPPVRAAVLPVQRRFAERGGVVAEGRDIGTVVFPDADVKFFLVADLRTRAERRARETGEADVAKVEAEIRARDEADSKRDASPLVAAPDAIRIDTTHLDVESMTDVLERRVRDAESRRV